MKVLVIFSAIVALSVAQNSSNIVGIIGGENILISQAPYQASIQDNFVHICGGAIISSHYVLTAAFCTLGKNINNLIVTVGSEDNTAGDIHMVNAVFSHPRYNPGTRDFDVAIIQLTAPIILGPTKQVILMPYPGYSLAANTQVYVSGWGSTNSAVDMPAFNLQGAVMAVSNFAQCRRLYNTRLTLQMTCINAMNRDACAGDTGGPVRRLSDCKLVGLFSFNPPTGCATAGIPSVYTKISAVRAWIRRTIAI